MRIISLTGALLYGPDRQALEACEEWCSDRLAREEAAAAAAVAAAPGDPGPGQATNDAYVKRRAIYGMYDVYGRLLRAEAGVSSHLPLHRSLGAFLQGEAWSPVDVVCSRMRCWDSKARVSGVDAVQGLVPNRQVNKAPTGP